jgi:hypothetical protein
LPGNPLRRNDCRLWRVAVVVEAAGEAERDQRVEDFLNIIARSTLETARQLLEMRGSAQSLAAPGTTLA